MATFPISLFVNKSVYATGSVNVLESLVTKKVKKTFKNGEFIGSVYTWLDNGGKFYLIFYLTNQDYVNNKASYLEISQNTPIHVVGLKEAVKKYEDDKKAELQQQQINEKGLFRYYLDKYLPVVIFGGLAVIALPKLLKSNNG